MSFTDVSTSCACVATAKDPFVLPPGAKKTIDMRIDLGGITGRFSQATVLSTPDLPTGQLELLVTGTIQRGLLLSPPRFDLGVCEPGAVFDRCIEATMSGDEVDFSIDTADGVALETVTKKDTPAGSAYVLRVRGRTPEKPGAFLSTFMLTASGKRSEVRQIEVEGCVGESLSITPRRIVVLPGGAGRVVVSSSAVVSAEGSDSLRVETSFGGSVQTLRVHVHPATGPGVYEVPIQAGGLRGSFQVEVLSAKD